MIFLFIFFFVVGCGIQTNQYKRCYKDRCTTEDQPPYDQDGSYLNIPTSRGGSVKLLTISPVQIYGTLEVLGASVYDGNTVVLTFEKLSSTNFRLRTRFLLNEGALASPLCDIGVDQFFRANFARINGDSFYIYNITNHTSQVNRYLLSTCASLNSSTYNYIDPLYNYNDISFFMTTDFWYFIAEGALKKISNTTKTLTLSLEGMDQGSARLRWRNQVVSESPSYLWVSDNFYVWRIDKSNFKYEWFEMPNPYHCISSSSITWIDGFYLNVVCNDPGKSLQKYTLDISNF
jgi:hypothetical protein